MNSLKIFLNFVQKNSFMAGDRNTILGATKKKENSNNVDEQYFYLKFKIKFLEIKKPYVHLPPVFEINVDVRTQHNYFDYADSTFKSLKYHQLHV